MYFDKFDRFSTKCRKTKTTLANHKGPRQSAEPIKTQSVDDAKRGKTHTNKPRLILVLPLIG